MSKTRRPNPTKKNHKSYFKNEVLIVEEKGKTDEEMVRELVSNGIVKFLLTPKLASAILNLQGDFNPRKVKRRLVEDYGKMMKQGQWHYNGDVIRFIKDTRLNLDGQHRCHGVINSGMPQIFIIVPDVPKVAIPTIDRGGGRTYGDVLRKEGIPFYNNVGSIVTALYRWEKGDIIKKSLSIRNIEELEELHKKNPFINQIPPKLSPLNKLIPTSMAGLSYYLLWKISPDSTDIFFNSIIKQANLPERSPILYLVKELQEMRIQNKVKKIQVAGSYYLALIIDAWNNWRNGKDKKPRVKTPLSWNDFPKPI